MRNIFLKMADNLAYAVLVVAIVAVVIFIVAVLVAVLRWIVIPILLIVGAIIWLTIRNNPIDTNRDNR